MWKIAEALGVHPSEIKEFANAYSVEDPRLGKNGSGKGTTGVSAGLPELASKTQDFFRDHDLQTLAAQQGVRPLASFEQLVGDFWPASESTEGFLDTLYEWRQGDEA